MSVCLCVCLFPACLLARLLCYLFVDAIIFGLCVCLYLNLFVNILHEYLMLLFLFCSIKANRTVILHVTVDSLVQKAMVEVE